MFKYNKLNTMKSFYSTDRINKISSESNNEIYNEYDTTETGNARHHPPVIRVWDNSVYNFNKNTQDDSLSKYYKLNKLIKGYFNLHNNIKLARSKRMRYLRTKSISSKRLFLSRPEIKQTNDKITITVYYFDKLKNSFSRKIFFFNRPYLRKFILRKKYKRKVFIKRVKFVETRIKYLGIKQVKEFKLFKDRNKFKNKYLEQSLWLYFFKYLLSLINVQIYNPISISNSFINKHNKKKYIKLLIKKESLNINNIINTNCKFIFWIDFNNHCFEKIEKENINYNYLMAKSINYYNSAFRDNYNNFSTKLNFLKQINRKLAEIVNLFIINNIISNSLLLKAYNYMSLMSYKGFSRKIYKKRYNKIYKLTQLSMGNVMKFKNLLPGLKMMIDTFYNKRTELNMVNLKYFFLNSDIYTQALVLKLKKKINPLKVINKSLRRVKVFYTHYNNKQVILNNINKLFRYTNISINSFPLNLLNNDLPDTLDSSVSAEESKLDKLQTIFDKLFPHNLMQKYTTYKRIFRKKISNILNTVKYKGILGIRVEANGRLTRRHKAARSLSHLIYKGNLKDNEFYFHEKENVYKSRPGILLRNDVRANTQYINKSSVRRIGSFGIKTWISSK